MDIEALIYIVGLVAVLVAMLAWCDGAAKGKW